jgi:hypothetical protein
VTLRDQAVRGVDEPEGCRYRHRTGVQSE